MKLLHTTDGYGRFWFYIDGRRVRRDVYERAIEQVPTRLMGGKVDKIVRRNALWCFYTFHNERD